MNRRTYLAILCAPLAGCASEEESAGDTPTATPTAGSTPTTAPSTATETATAEPTETPTETETETPTPSDEAVAAEHIDAADDRLQAAVAAFTEPADGDGLLAVDGSVAPDEDAVTGELSAMQDELDAAADYATGDQQGTVEDLRHLRGFLADLLAVQADANALWTAARDGIAAAIGESFDDLGDRMTELSDGSTKVSNGVETLADGANPGATAVTDAVSEAEYTGKRDQLAAERETADAIADVLGPLEEGMVDFEEGTDYYTAGSISSAEAPFWGSHNDLVDAVEAMPDDHAEAYAPLIADLDCFLSAVEVAADKLERSARLGREKVSEDAAQDALEGCDLVADSPSATQMLEWLQNR